MTRSPNAEIPYMDTREAYFDLFDGVTQETTKGREKRHLPGGLVKSYLLETLGDTANLESFEKLFARSNLTATPISGDERIFRITDARHNGIALAERFDDRYLALYTLLPTNTSDSLVQRAVSSNPLLDHLWLSSQSFNALWDHVRRSNSGRRYGRITFEHESIFEYPEADVDEHVRKDERRASRFTMVDRLDEIQAQMGPLRNTYAPLASITHLRIPAASRGGHDLYYDGKVTNRSDSFLDHRASLTNVIQMYSGLTQAVEEKLWISGPEDHDESFALDSAVAELIFSQPLSEAAFKRWVLSLFNNKRNRFRISGFHTWLSDRKVHANAIDQHLWQPIILELTPSRVVAVLPKGTCGNSVNRLISNVQRYIDPNVRAYIGDVEYSEMIPLAGIEVG
ncbi:Uncharacterised protein [Mycobacterium tuberculosis]|nr:Uncharacterised protein [Mycobacterium tuberculosis]